MNFENDYSCSAHHRINCCPGEVGRKEKRLLYAVAYEFRVSRGKWKPEIDYLHASDANDAQWWFFQSEAPDVFRQVRVVGVAPVVAYFANDAHGDDVSV
jgi:hypothetical protein